jgi:hypothetical protein
MSVFENELAFRYKRSWIGPQTHHAAWRFLGHLLDQIERFMPPIRVYEGFYDAGEQAPPDFFSPG